MSERNYDSSDIQILEGLEAVRKRPGMYIGSTGSRGLHHLVWEIVDNSIDEALVGVCTEIEVVILPDNIISVKDNGRGIPVGIHEKTGRPAVETIFTTLHAGGKFGGGSYKVSGGLHGVGSSVVNALSEWLEVIVRLDGNIYKQKFSYGKPVSDLEIVGETNETGTTVIFKPDSGTFTDTTEYDFEILRNRIRELAFLNKKLKISIEDVRTSDVVYEDFYYEGGIKEYVEFLNEGKDALHDDVIYVEGNKGDIQIEVALQYNTTYGQHLFAFTNNIINPNGGTHELGFRVALTRILNSVGKEKNIFKKDESLSGDDVREGLTAIISCKHPNPQFEGQTKSKLGNTEVRGITDKIFSKGFEKYLLENPAITRVIIEKALMASRARIAAKKAREATRRKSPLDTLGFASKLADCRSKDPGSTEIYIVEGDSAGGSAKQGRDSGFQAILPLRGKVLNVEKARLDKILNNREIISMIQAFGTGIGEEFNADKCRYHKIVIMTDADVDGAHIRTLLLTFLFRYMKELIDRGYIYIAQPPLFKISQRQRIEYAYTDQQMKNVLNELSETPKPTIQRYKGLGEMNAEQLWETTMNPEVRTLLKVTLEDAIEADRIFSMLMGENVEKRREFIEDNALNVENLDI